LASAVGRPAGSSSEGFALTMQPSLAEPLAETFTRHRRHLFGIAYRMLGSAAEADDVLQEAYLRAVRAAELPERPSAYLATIVTRLCLDVLKSARIRRAAYVGPWLPEPVRSEEIATLAGDEPSSRIDTAESLSMGFLLLLETLSPLERAALVLRDVFDWDYDEIAATLERRPATCRQLVRRARGHLAARQPRFVATEAERQRLFEAFLAAILAGDEKTVTQMLAADATSISDSDGKARAARRVLHGADRVARFLVGVARKGDGGEVSLVSLNGGPALLGRKDGRTILAMGLDVSSQGIERVWLVVNPDKLARLALG
jgi:RNA polymerase sigma-70 factor, ECF subfamily